MDVLVMILHALQICNVHVVSVILLGYIYSNFINSVLYVFFLTDIVTELSIFIFLEEKRKGNLNLISTASH